MSIYNNLEHITWIDFVVCYVSSQLENISFSRSFASWLVVQ